MASGGIGQRIRTKRNRSQTIGGSSLIRWSDQNLSWAARHAATVSKPSPSSRANWGSATRRDRAQLVRHHAPDRLVVEAEHDVVLTHDGKLIFGVRHVIGEHARGGRLLTGQDSVDEAPQSRPHVAHLERGKSSQGRGRSSPAGGTVRGLAQVQQLVMTIPIAPQPQPPPQPVLPLQP